MTPEERRALIRRDFEIERDLAWAEHLEPKFRAAVVGGERLEEYRAAWNARAEARDWPWWQETLGRYSDERLQDAFMDTVERADALGLLQWRRERAERPPGRAAAAEDQPRQSWEDALRQAGQRGGPARDREMEQ